MKASFKWHNSQKRGKKEGMEEYRQTENHVCTGTHVHTQEWLKDR